MKTSMKCLLTLTLWCGHLHAQVEPSLSSSDSTMVSRIHAEVLGQGACYENLRVLCKDIGARLSGSPEANAAGCGSTLGAWGT